MPTAHADSPVTQFAVLDALLAGAYGSGIAVRDVRPLGGFGVGCCDALGGEVVILDGDLYECTVDEPPHAMPDDESLPFVDVSTPPGGAPEPVRDLDLASFVAVVEDALVSRNLFHAVRVDGRFASVSVRVTPRERHPFRPLAEVVAGQVVTVLDDVAGTLVGFWSPGIYQGVTVAGLHVHFLARDRSAGGHVLDLRVEEAELRMTAHDRFHLRLPTDDLFLRTELTHDEDRRIVAVEAGGAGA